MEFAFLVTQTAYRGDPDLAYLFLLAFFDSRGNLTPANGRLAARQWRALNKLTPEARYAARLS